MKKTKEQIENERYLSWLKLNRILDVSILKFKIKQRSIPTEIKTLLERINFS